MGKVGVLCNVPTRPIGEAELGAILTQAHLFYHILLSEEESDRVVG